MKLLKTIYPYEVDPTSPVFDYASFTPRPAVRAIIFASEKVALIHVKHDGYYMLPGGGIDEGEDVQVALAREVREELGCEVAVDGEIGEAITYMDRWKNRQEDHCCRCQLLGKGMQQELTDFETEAGYELVWATNLVEAIQLVRQAKPVGRDGLLIQARDSAFLEAAGE